MCYCCCPDDRKVPDKEETYKNLQKELDQTKTDYGDEDDEHAKKNQNYFYMEDKLYDDEELLNMKIIDINFGIHQTKITSGSNKGNISFHPFFYVKLNNKKDIGVIIQYLKIEEQSHNLTHLWEENGVEYLEKNKKKFELEYLNFIKKVSEIDLFIDDWLINYNIYDLQDVQITTLRDLFNKIIPKKGIWLQNKLNPLTHGCIHFCIEAIKNLGIKKKKNQIKEIKERMRKVLDFTKNQKYYQNYCNGFKELFKEIEI